ncbi:MAG: hypothetical protein IKI24_04530 [Clostridia bacterium]|nr:hypothetical protein [Clostridia bacterium]
MDRLTIEGVAEELGLVQKGNMYTGIVNGFPVAVTDAKKAVSCVIQTSIRPKNSVMKKLKELRKATKSAVLWNDYIMRLSVDKQETSEGSQAQVLEKYLAILSGEGITPLDRCPVCRKGGCDAAAPIGGVMALAHMDCLKMQAEKTKTKLEDGEFSGSYITGIIGAVLGMIVGTLPNLLLIILLQRVFALAMCLIPICAYYGYKLFGGKRDKFAIVISIIMAVAGVMLIQWELVAYTLVHDYNQSLSRAVSLTWKQMGDFSNWLELAKDAGMEFLMAVLGVFISFGVISRTDKGDAKLSEDALEGAIPYNK